MRYSHEGLLSERSTPAHEGVCAAHFKAAAASTMPGLLLQTSGCSVLQVERMSATNAAAQIDL